MNAFEHSTPPPPFFMVGLWNERASAVVVGRGRDCQMFNGPRSSSTYAVREFVQLSSRHVLVPHSPKVSFARVRTLMADARESEVVGSWHPIDF